MEDIYHILSTLLCVSTICFLLSCTTHSGSSAYSNRITAVLDTANDPPIFKKQSLQDSLDSFLAELDSLFVFPQETPIYTGIIASGSKIDTTIAFYSCPDFWMLDAPNQSTNIAGIAYISGRPIIIKYYNIIKDLRKYIDESLFSEINYIIVKEKMSSCRYKLTDREYLPFRKVYRLSDGNLKLLFRGEPFFDDASSL